MLYLTLDELRDKLLDQYDPDDLIEMLQISAEELLDRFEDKLINRFETLQDEFLEEVEDDDEY
jgi:hypothetical protein